MFQNGMRARAAVVGPALPAALAEKFEGTNAVLVGALGPRQREVVRLAYAQSLRNMWVMYTAVAGLGLGLGLVARAFITERTLRETHVEVGTGVIAVEWMAVEVKPVVP